MADEQTLRDYVTLVRGITYKGNLVGKPGPALLGLGSIHPGGGFREGDYKTYGGDCPPKLMLTPGDLFVSLKGATKDGKMIGSVARVPVSVPSGRLTQDTVKLEFRSAEKAKSSSYLYWLLRTPQYRAYCDGRAMGSAVVALSRDDFLDYTVPNFSGARKGIVEVLERIEEKIELNRRMNATLEAMARALFQSWFVDFDPVRAKLDGRQPAGLDSATAALFPDHLEDSPLGYIPKGWSVARLDDIAIIMMGLSPDGDSYNADGIGTPLINGPVEFGEYFPVKTKWTEAATRFAAAGDLIFCVRGSTTGRRVISDGEYGIGRGVCAIRAQGGFHSFLYQTINVGLDRLLEKTTGSVFPSLSAPDIKGFSVLKPSKGVLEAYERATKPLVERIQQNQHQSRTLATLRDTLLPKLLSGELRLRN
jgi:type I restriction enzyme S subunit